MQICYFFFVYLSDVLVEILKYDRLLFIKEIVLLLLKLMDLECDKSVVRVILGVMYINVELDGKKIQFGYYCSSYKECV